MSWVHAGLWSDSLTSQFGGQYANGAVTVLEHGTQTPAVLYADSNKTDVLANPTATDDLGNLMLYVEPGLYDLATPGSEGTPFITIVVTPNQADLTGSGSSGVTSWNARSGVVVPEAGDYTAAQVGAVPVTLVDAAGDLLVGSAADTLARLPVSATAGDVLTADPAQPNKIKWAPAAGGGGGVTSFNTRTGAVVPADGDYTPAQVGADVAGSATAALAAANNYTDTQVAGRVPTARTITAGTGLTGGGDLTANRSFAVSYGTAAGTAAQGNDSRIVGAAPAASPTFTGTVTNDGRGVEKLTDLGNVTGAVTPDALAGNRLKATLTGNITLNAPSNPPGAGLTQGLILELVQDSTGSRTLTLDAAIKTGTTIGAPVLSTGAGKKDVIGLYYDGAAWLLTAYALGY